MIDLKNIFVKPETPRHRQYEALRAIVVDDIDVQIVAKKYGYSIATLYSRMRDLRAGKLIFFPKQIRGPQGRKTPEYIRDIVLTYRKDNLSSEDIKMKLEQEGYKFSVRTVERILTDAQLPKLIRRSLLARGITQKNEIISQRSEQLNFSTLKPFKYDCPVIGVFFFIPYIIESGILDIVKHCKLPESSSINAKQACLSMLLLKLIGSDRLSHISDYDHEVGFGIFAGLNFLPKSTFMATYSCRTSEELMHQFQQQLMSNFLEKYPDFYTSNFINLDFHSIPHFGDQSKMEKVWCGARGKAIKGANTIFAQDSESNAILYTCADILRKNEPNEIIKFVEYWKKIRGKNVKETLVFDCKLTTYKVLDTLENVKFISLRKRTKKLISFTEKIPENNWQKMYLPIPKRKHKACRIYESNIILPNCSLTIRQIIITDHGRSQPTYVITNNNDLSLKDILIIYAKRWHIEQKFAELVSFFNLNALSSPLMIRIHFDILWTIIADTLYHRFAQHLPRFEHERADSIFRHFINMPGQINYNGQEFIIKIRKRAHTPILLGVKNLNQSFKVPWLDNKLIKIEWTS